MRALLSILLAIQASTAFGAPPADTVRRSIDSTKQIVQIQQIISLLCARFGESLLASPTFPPVHAFPTAQRLAIEEKPVEANKEEQSFTDTSLVDMP